MKTGFLAMAVAAAVGVATSANALNISVGNIIPPGGNQEQASLVAGTDLSLFTVGTGLDNPMSGSDISTLSGIAGLYSGSVVVFAMNTGAGTALVAVSNAAFTLSSATSSESTGGFETGGMNVYDNGSGGIVAFGGPSASGGLYGFAMVNMGAWSTGAMTLVKGASTDVKFLRYTGSGWAVSNTGNYSGSGSSGSLDFNFQVLPVPAPALLAGAGLIGAGVIRRRMKRN